MGGVNGGADGFDFGYPKPAPKLPFGQPQTILMCCFAKSFLRAPNVLPGSWCFVPIIVQCTFCFCFWIFVLSSIDFRINEIKKLCKSFLDFLFVIFPPETMSFPPNRTGENRTLEPNIKPNRNPGSLASGHSAYKFARVRSF